MSYHTRTLTLAGLGAGAVLGAGLLWRSRGRTSLPEVQTAALVDLERYAGRWFEIARYPTRFERQCDRNTTAEYAPLGPGRLRIENRCTRADGTTSSIRGTARVSDAATNAKFKVKLGRFIPKADYWIVDLDPDYRWAVVGEPGRRFLWVLSRTPSLDQTAFESIAMRLRRQHYDPDLLVRTKQDGA